MGVDSTKEIQSVTKHNPVRTISQTDSAYDFMSRLTRTFQREILELIPTHRTPGLENADSTRKYSTETSQGDAGTRRKINDLVKGLDRRQVGKPLSIIYGQRSG